MLKAKRGYSWFALTSSLLVVCLLLVFNGRGLVPEAAGQSFPTKGCQGHSSPCDTCTDTDDASQCIINLGGWTWGDCDPPSPSGCTQNQSDCGAEYNCDNPPKVIGACTITYNICT